MVLVDALEQLSLLYNEKLLAGSVDYVERSERARAKLDQLKSKASLGGSGTNADSKTTAKKSRRGHSGTSNSQVRKIK